MHRSPQEKITAPMPAPDPTPPAESQATRRRLRLLLAAILIHGLAYLALLPPWMGEDEPWHFENLTHVSNGYWAKSDRTYTMDDIVEAPLTHIQAMRRFDKLEQEEAARVQRDILDSMRRNQFWRRVDWAGRNDAADNFDEVALGFSTAQQPPLYYFVAAPIVTLMRGASLEAQLFCVRLFSLGLLVLTVYLTFLAARLVFPGSNDRPALLAAFFAGWFPMHARMAAVVSNDVLARLLVTLALYLSLRLTARLASRKELGALLLVCVLAIATKTTAASAFGLAALGFLLMPRELGLARKKWLLVPVTLVLGGAAVFFWKSMNNPAIPYSLDQLAKRFDYALSPRAFVEVRDSFLGAFNWESRPQAGWVQSAFGVFVLAALGGSLLAIRRLRGTLSSRLLVLCFGAFALQFALILLRGVGKGRYLMPAIAALSILVIAGLVQALPERWRARAGLALVLLLVTYDACFMWQGLVTNQYLIWGN